MVKGSLGTGIMAMPLAFKNGGLIFGSIGTVVICIIYGHSVHMLVRYDTRYFWNISNFNLLFAGQHVSKTMQENSNTSIRLRCNSPSSFQYWTFSDATVCEICVVRFLTAFHIKCSIATFLFRWYYRVFIDWMLVIDSVLSICLYIVFIAQSIQDVIYNQQGLDWDTRIYILLLLIPIIVIMQVRELKQLVPFTAVANMLIIASVGISLYFIFSKPISLTDRMFWPQWTTIPTFVR